MSGLVIKFQKIDFSIAYDTLTIYIKSKHIDNIEKYVTDKSHTPGVEKDPTFLEDLNFWLLLNKAAGSLINLKYKKTYFEGFKQSFSDDHDLYHEDGLNRNAYHYHKKFRSRITREHFDELLEIYHQYNVITLQEKQRALLEFDRFYAAECEKFDALLIGIDTIDFYRIKNWIADCKSNDILAHIHTHLTNNKFDYLRQFTSPTQWQGTNAEKKIVPTSEVWAGIEKAFTLQMQRNIYTKTSFSTTVSEPRSIQLGAGHCFFSIKRKTKHGEMAESKNFVSFFDADKEKLEQSYSKHFPGNRG